MTWRAMTVMRNKLKITRSNRIKIMRIKANIMRERRRRRMTRNTFNITRRKRKKMMIRRKTKTTLMNGYLLIWKDTVGKYLIVVILAI